MIRNNRDAKPLVAASWEAVSRPRISGRSSSRNGFGQRRREISDASIPATIAPVAQDFWFDDFANVNDKAAF